MKILVFCPEGQELLDRLHAVIDETVGAGGVEWFQSIDEVCHRLRRPLKRPVSLVLAAPSSGVLDELLQLSEFLNDVKTILILPDGGAKTLRQGLKLHPSFFTTKDNDLSEIKSVLQKMLKMADR